MPSSNLVAETLPLSRDDDNDAGQALLSEEWFLRRVAGRAFPEVHAASGRQHLYYVMREYPGQTLAQLFLQQGPLPLAQWQFVAERLLRAVGLLHRRQILHRDIKPENLLLGDDGELRVLDFGLAYCPGLSEDRAHVLPGTPSFIAPEAFQGDRPTAQQDLYSVGVSLYYLLTGHYPYGEIELSNGNDLAELVQVLRHTLIGSIDMLQDLLFAYSPVLAADRERIEAEAFDEEALAAFVEVLKLAYPLACWRPR